MIQHALESRALSTGFDTEEIRAFLAGKVLARSDRLRQ